jgi:hypothetical protein
MKPEDISVILYKQHLNDSIKNRLANNPNTSEPIPMESALLQVISGSILTDSQYNYKYKLLNPLQ